MGEAHLIHGSSGAFEFLEQEEELERIYSNACAQYGAITHDAFLALLVSFQPVTLLSIVPTHNCGLGRYH